MKLITKKIEHQLIQQGRRAQYGDDTSDHKPVLKLFVPWSVGTWLISEIDPDDMDTMFGLCDLGMGCPELGYVSLSEIKSVKGPFGLKIERDMHFKATKSLTAYADEARQVGQITV